MQSRSRHGRRASQCWPADVRIVSISPYMPFSGIPHAGGDFLRRHAELASRSHDFLVVSPRTADNEAAVVREEHHVARPLAVPSDGEVAKPLFERDVTRMRMGAEVARDRLEPTATDVPAANTLTASSD